MMDQALHVVAGKTLLLIPKGNLGEEVKLTGILSFKKTIFKEELKKN